MLNTTFAPWPSYTQQEADAVSQVLLSNKVNYWTGNETRQFEQEFAEHIGVKHAIALANGTLALEAAMFALDIGAGAEVVCTPRSFIASASCVISSGAMPVFADIDPNTQCLSAETIEPVITDKTRAIIVVHLAGYPADMDPILALAQKYNLAVIEDCAQAHGARYKGKSVGCFSDIAAWSFCQDKIMTTGGEGGMVTTNDHALWSKMWSHKDHGKSWKAVYEREHPPGYRWLHESFGTNWRMTELQGVIGRIQLDNLTQWNEKRNANAARIWQACKACEWLRVPELPADCVHAAYKANAFIIPDRLPVSWTRDKIVDELISHGVPAKQGSCSEMYREKAFDGHPSRPTTRLPIAQELGETSLEFLVHPTLSLDNIQTTVTAIEAINLKLSALIATSLEPIKKTN